LTARLERADRARLALRRTTLELQALGAQLRQDLARRWSEYLPPMVIVLMGVAGSGKTTVGQALAAQLGWTFRDADDFHPPANVEKMSRGIPLTDRDRQPWLAAIRAYIDETLARGDSAVVTCSALKERYRRIIVPDPARVRLVYLAGDFALIAERLRARKGHFMKPDMLSSQLSALEPPRDALTVDVAEPPEVIVARIRTALSL
jgi:gluconokinase